MERLEAGGVDLLVSDVMLPGRSGLDLAAWTRERPDRARAVLLISARGDVGDRVEGLAVAGDYLAKPFQARELLARCDALLRRAPQVSGVEAPLPIPDPAGRTPTGKASSPAPGQPPALSESDARFLAALEAAADARISDETLDLDALALAVGMSRRALHGRLGELGLGSPGVWLRERRMAHAEELMARGVFETVGEVAAAVGMSRAYFTRLYTAQNGFSPGSRLRGREGG